MAELLPMRPCIGCGKTDDHPRHHILLDDGAHSSVFWHMDCHALSGCEVCAGQTSGAKGATGAKLREHLVSLPAKEN